MRIVADENIPFVAEAFGALGELVALPTPMITPEIASQAEILVIRNETPVHESLLRGSHVRFVASATAGCDHVDFEYLKAHRIGFANAPGANANSVKEYVVAALLAFAARRNIELSGKTLSVIGVGNIGSRVAEAGRALGMHVLENDPPLARSTGDSRFVTLEEALPADFISLHTPLTYAGRDATFHLFDLEQISRMKDGAVLVNTSRGAVVETSALRNALQQGKPSGALIDVWENEPFIDADLLALSTIGTAHVAGYSMEGKLAALRMVREAVCEYFGLSAPWDPAQHLEPRERIRIRPGSDGMRRDLALHNIVQEAYRIEGDDTQLRRMLDLTPEDREAYYIRLRTCYPSRREFSSYTVELNAEYECLGPTLSALGFVHTLAASNPLRGTMTATGRQS